MADGRDLQKALEISRLRVTVVEERPVLNAFSNIERRISEYISREEIATEAKEPYEFK